MPLNIIAWLVSLGVHAAFVLALLLPDSGGAAIQEGSGGDVMVVEQGIAIEGIAKLGEDVMSVEAVEAPPMMTAAAQPLEQVEAVAQQEEMPVEDVPEVEPVEDTLLTSEAGPENELIEPVEELVQEEPEPEVKEQPLPQQLASVAQQTVIAMRESSGQELSGGDATAHRAYLGKLRVHLERAKINPRTTRVGTAVVRLTVKSDGELVAHKIVKSSGYKELDKAALDSIASAAPYPAIPSEVGEETISVSVPFRFTVR
jgi:protein TonB